MTSISQDLPIFCGQRRQIDRRTDRLLKPLAHTREVTTTVLVPIIMDFKLAIFVH